MKKMSELTKDELKDTLEVYFGWLVEQVIESMMEGGV